MLNFRKKNQEKCREPFKSKTEEQSKGNKALQFKVRKFRTMESKVRKFISRCEFPKWKFRTPLFKVRKFSHRAKFPPDTRVPFRTPQGHFRTVRIKVRKFRTPQFKVRKFIPRFEILFSRCEFFRHHFRTPLFKVRKFSHRANHPPGTRVEFRTPQAKFRTVRNKVRNWVRNAKQGANSLVQSMEISHDAIQGAKFPVQGAKISHGKILSCKNS